MLSPIITATASVWMAISFGRFEDGGEIVAFLYGFLYEIPGMLAKPIAILDALYVEKEHRRKGYASQLISAFKPFAEGKRRLPHRAEGAYHATEAALHLYEKLSFKETKYMAMDFCRRNSP